MHILRFMEQAHPIKTMRENLGWDRRKLADETGVDVSTVSRWERSVVEPSGSAKVILDRLFRRAASRAAPAPQPSKENA